MNRSIGRRLFLTSLALFGLSVFFASAASAAEIIRDYRTEIRINPDSSFAVRETIVYDFGSQQKHGIFRKIPYKYQARGGNFEYRYSDFSVTDGAGRSYKFEKNSEGSDQVLKIGDPNLTITGAHTYVISYQVRRGINFFQDHDELYWNVIGTGWDYPIEKAAAVVNLPAGADSGNVQTACFYGPYGSKQACLIQSEGKSIAFASPAGLVPKEGLTVVVGLPKGILREPSRAENMLEVVKDNGILSLPILVLAGMFWLWRTKGRDPQGRGAIIAQFQPPTGLTPLEASVIVDEKFENKDISAAIVDLAIRGYLKINRTEEDGFLFGKVKDYRLDKLKSQADLANDFERRIMTGLFGGTGTEVKLSSLKNEFYKDLAEISKEVLEKVSKEYFEGNPSKVSLIYKVVGILAVMAGFYLGSNMGIISAISLVISGIIVVIFGTIMPRKTPKGVETKEYIQGLKLYMSVAEKDRINFHNAPAKNPEHFEKLLPYAMMLGVEKEWAKQFEGIYNQPPGWYSDPSGQMFSAAGLTDSLNSFSTASSNITSAPGGGSGFSGGGSGGGGGGGGGGSW